MFVILFFSNFRHAIKNSFLKNIFILATGTIFGQIIMVLALPILTRFYTPGDFNLLAIYAALVMTISVVGCARLDLALPLVEREKDAINVLILAVFSASVFSFFLSILLLFFSDSFLNLLHQPKLKPFLWMIPVGVWIASLYSMLQYWSVRHNRFSQVAATHLLRSTVCVTTQLGFGQLKLAPFGLIFGHMLYGGFGVIGLTSSLWRKERHLFRYISIGRAIKNLKEQKRFPLYSAPESLLDAVANNIPIVMIAAVNSSSEAGFYMLAQRVLSVPIGLLGRNISRVYIVEASNQKKKGTLGKFTRKIIRNLTLVSFIPFLILGVISPYMFPLVFGDSWESSGMMVTWMVPFMFLQFIATPVATILHITKNQKMAFLLQLFGFILLIGAIILAIFIDKEHAFEFFAIASFVYYLTYLGSVLYLSRE